MTYTDGSGNVLGSYQAVEGATTPEQGQPSKDVRVFIGWNPAVAETVTADVTYEAQWADDWNGNGIPDTEDPSFQIVYKDGETVLGTFTVLTGLTTPGCAPGEKEGKVFEGWNPAVADVVTADATYVAQWSDIPKEEPAAPAEKSPEKTAETGEEPEEIDDETLENEYMTQAEKSSISISIDGASRIGRGKFATYTAKVTGVPEGQEATISWRLSSSGLTATSAQKDGNSFKVSVGENETAESLRVIVTVTVGDISVSRGKRVPIVDPAEQTEEKQAVEKQTEAKPEDAKNEQGTSQDDGKTPVPDTQAPSEKPDPSEDKPLTEEELGNMAMQEENNDPVDDALLNF